MTIIVIIFAAALIGAFFYLKNSAKKTADTINDIVEGAKEIQSKAQAEVEKEMKPKKKSAPRKKKETTSATEGPIKGEYYKQPR